MNQFTIEFRGPKDLAKKIAEYNELMNGKAELSIEDKEPVKVVEVVAATKDEVKTKPVEVEVDEPVEVEEPKNQLLVPRLKKKSLKTYLLSLTMYLLPILTVMKLINLRKNCLLMKLKHSTQKRFGTSSKHGWVAIKNELWQPLKSSKITA